MTDDGPARRRGESWDDDDAQQATNYPRDFATAFAIQAEFEKSPAPFGQNQRSP